MPREAIAAVLAGMLGATMFQSSLVGMPAGKLLAIVSALPLFVTGLGFGASKAALAGLTGGVLLLAMNSVMAVSFILVDVLPAVFVARQGLRVLAGPDGTVGWMTPGRILGGLAALALGMLAVLAMEAPSHTQGLEGLIREELQRQLSRGWPEGGEEPGAWAAAFAPLLPGATMNMWVLRAVALAALAQWGLERLGRNLRPTPRYIEVMLPHWVVGMFMAVAGPALVMGGDAGYIARNGALVLSLPLFLQGLAAVHAEARRTKGPSLLLGAFYVTYLLSTWGYVAVVGLGFVEHIVKRRRPAAAGGGSGREEE
ncbi:MAG: YybS family protein [Alphaproteobacteria bacterium]